MALNFYEQAKSRPIEQSVDSKSLTLKYIAMYATDENTVATGLLLVAPRKRDGLLRTSYKCDPIGAGIWMCEVAYSWSAVSDEAEDPEETEILGPESSFDITTNTAHITQSLETQYKWRSGITTDTPAGDAVKYGTNLTVNEHLNPNSCKVTPDGYTPVAGDVGKRVYVSGGSYGSVGWKPGAYTITAQAAGKWTITGRPAGAGFFGGRWMLADGNLLGTAADYKQAIGVTTEGIAGTDVYTPKFEFTMTRQIAAGLVDLTYLRKLRTVVAKTNDRAWRGWQTGEVLYLGATGSCGPNNVWTLNHKFAVGENLYGIQVSPTLMIPQKRAWEYVWTSYGFEADNVLVMQRPTAAYVESVYRAADFRILGLGK